MSAQKINQSSSFYSGHWFIRDAQTVVYVLPDCLESAYTKKCLEIAIATTKANRSSYATQEAYEAALKHFDHGLGLFV